MSGDANGAAPAAARTHQVTGCWRIERGGDGRWRPHVFLIADGSVVIADAALDFPTLEAGQVLAATISNMLAQQPPELVRP